MSPALAQLATDTIVMMIKAGVDPHASARALKDTAVCLHLPHPRSAISNPCEAARILKPEFRVNVSREGVNTHGTHAVSDIASDPVLKYFSDPSTGGPKEFFATAKRSSQWGSQPGSGDCDKKVLTVGCHLGIL